jgi:hypothetical protein
MPIRARGAALRIDGSKSDPITPDGIRGGVRALGTATFYFRFIVSMLKTGFLAKDDTIDYPQWPK